MSPRLSVFVLGLILVVFPRFAPAQDCPELAGRSPAGVTQAVVAQGTLAFMGNGAALEVIDLSVPASPVVVGSLWLDYDIQSLAVDGGRVYAGTVQKLHIIDVSIPSAPVELGALPRFGAKYGLGASGNTVCVVERTELVVVDVSVPAAPVAAGSWSGAYPHDVEVAGQVAYVMAGGLRVLNLADPFNPTQIGLYAIAGESLDVEGNLVFVAGSRLTAIDISDPTTPVFVGMVDLPSGSATTDVAVHGDLAYVSTQLGGLHVVDVSDSQNPGWSGTAPQPADRLNEYWVAAAAIADHGLVATTDHGVRVIDATDSANPVEIAVVDSPGWTTGGAYSAGILVTANYERGIRIIDIADPSTPVELAILDLGLGWWVEDVDVAGTVVVAVGLSFAVVDITDPTNPIVVGETPMWEVQGMGVELVGNLAYVADPVRGLRIIDVSDPANPTEIGSLPFAGDYWEYLDVDGTLVVLQGSTLEIIDVSNPVVPEWMATIDHSPFRRGIALSRSSLFTVSAGLRTFDLSDPTNPVETNVLPDPRIHTPIGISGSVAYVGTSGPDVDFEIEVWDIGNPDDPILMGTHPGPGYVTDFAFSGDHVFSTRYYSGFDILVLCQGPIFADDFETGDTMVWSTAVP